MTALASVFLASLPAALREQAGSVSGLEAQLGALAGEAKAAWPGIEVSDADFVAHVARVLPADGALAEMLAGLCAGELYLAAGCVLGNEAAGVALERGYGPELAAALAGFADDRTSLEDLVQIARTKLYSKDQDGRPTLARYNGLGSFAGWLRVVSTRAAMNALRARKVRDGHPEATGIEILADPELDYFREHYSDAFKRAFEAAVEELTPRERTLLRYSVVHGMSVRKIAQMYGVHAATTARWVSSAREKLVDRTRTRLADGLGVGGEQLASIMRLIQSQLDVSIARALGDDGA